MASLVTLARPYAKAAFKVAFEQKALAEWENLLGILAALFSEKSVLSFVGNPSLSRKDVVAFLKEAAKIERVDVEHFLDLLAYYRRLPTLPEISRQFSALRRAQEGVVEVEVCSAMPLEKVLQDKFLETLKSKLQRDVKINFATDPTLIGGAVVKTGDVVINGSFA